MAKNKKSSNHFKQSNFGSSADIEGAKVPPQAVEIEEAVLGSILIDPDITDEVFGLIKKDDFYKPAHQHIYQSFMNLRERDSAIDLLTVENELSDLGLLDICGGSTYLAELTKSVSSSANIIHHIEIINEKAIKRNLIAKCTDIINEAYDTSSDSFELLDTAEQRIYDLANQKNKNESRQVSDVLRETLDYLVEMRGQKFGITGVPTALAVDQMTAGWQNGDLIIIAARPSMGKTAFVLTTARNAAMYPDKELRKPVAIFSLEMSSQQLVQRLITMEARVSADDARKGKLNDDGFEELIKAAGRLFDAPIFIDDTPAITLMELRAKCRRLKSKHDIGLIVIDYLQLMQGHTKDGGNREQEIASISRGLKALAKELDVPVIALSQLSRAVEQRGGDKRPQLSDLRESGSIEQDADVVIFLYRPEYYGINTTADGQSTAGLAEIIIGKQRNGPVGTRMLHFIKDYARFENLTTADPFHDGNYNASFDAEPSSAPPMPHNPLPDDDAPF